MLRIACISIVGQVTCYGTRSARFKDCQLIKEMKTK